MLVKRDLIYSKHLDDIDELAKELVLRNTKRENMLLIPTFK